MKLAFGIIISCLSCAFAPAAETKQSNIEQTLSIIKPDAVAANHIGVIVKRFEDAGFYVAGAKMVKLTKTQAEGFYEVHKERPFFNDLIQFMISGPIFVQVLEGPNAVAKNREIMGATDPKKAESGTLRGSWGTDVTHNAVHGSDSLENAQKEITYFFKPDEIFPRASQKAN